MLMRRFLLAVGWLLAACSGAGEGDAPQFTTRAATLAECPNGGSVGLADGEVWVVACHGAPGMAGSVGAPGAMGARGQDGSPGSSNVIATTVLCQADDGTSFLSAYLWVFDPSADSNDDIGVCSIGEGAFQQTRPFIGSACTLISPAKGGTVTLDVSTNPPSVTGAIVGTMSCI